MRWITHTHTQRYYTHYKTIGCGHLYQGRFKSFPIEKDTYFFQLCRYVKRNPVRAGLVQKAEDWKWSSLWIRERGVPEWKNLLSEWPVERPIAYMEWVNELQQDEEERCKQIRYATKRGRPFGSESWIQKNGKASWSSFNIEAKRETKKRYLTPFVFPEPKFRLQKQGFDLMLCFCFGIVVVW